MPFFPIISIARSRQNAFQSTIAGDTVLLITIDQQPVTAAKTATLQTMLNMKPSSAEP